MLSQSVVLDIIKCYMLYDCNAYMACTCSMDVTGDNCVVCSCGKPAVLLTVKNPSSSNLGKN